MRRSLVLLCAGLTMLSAGALPSISTVPAIVPMLASATGRYATLGNSIDPADVRCAVRACAVRLASPEHAKRPEQIREHTRLQRDSDKGSGTATKCCARARRVVLVPGWCTGGIN